MAPKTQEKTPFYKVFISKLFTNTKFPTFIDLYCQYRMYEDSINDKDCIINDIIKVWESSSIPIINKYSISNKFDRFLRSIQIFTKYNNKENFNIKYIEFFSRYDILYNIAAFCCCYNTTLDIMIKYKCYYDAIMVLLFEPLL